jgi:thiamine-phosphate pyrophosphorylase
VLTSIIALPRRDGRKTMLLTDQLKLCLVTDFTTSTFADYQQFILQIARGGVTCVQLRAKNSSLADILKFAQILKELLTPFSIPLIINDHLDVAIAVDAAGVHLGQADTDPANARALLGPTKIIGLSIETLAQLDQANKLDCLDYVAASAVFASKTDCKTIWELTGLNELVKFSQHPVVAIGGINANNIASVIAQGVCGVAVISAIHQHPDPAAQSTSLLHKINHTLNRLGYV